MYAASPQALEVSIEYLRLYTAGSLLLCSTLNTSNLYLPMHDMNVLLQEIISRAAQEAELSNDAEITVEHLEKVLPQMLLDF